MSRFKVLLKDKRIEFMFADDHVTQLNEVTKQPELRFIKNGEVMKGTFFIYKDVKAVVEVNSDVTEEDFEPTLDQIAG